MHARALWEICIWICLLHLVVILFCKVKQKPNVKRITVYYKDFAEKEDL